MGVVTNDETCISCGNFIFKSLTFMANERKRVPPIMEQSLLPQQQLQVVAIRRRGKEEELKHPPLPWQLQEDERRQGPNYSHKWRLSNGCFVGMEIYLLPSSAELSSSLM